MGWWMYILGVGTQGARVRYVYFTELLEYMTLLINNRPWILRFGLASWVSGNLQLCDCVGSLLCVCIVWCNLAVTRALCHSVQSDKTAESDTLPRRISRNQSMNLNTCTREELAFGRLMALFCVVFLLCWMPQMVRPHYQALTLVLKVHVVKKLYRHEIQPIIIFTIAWSCSFILLRKCNIALLYSIGLQLF